MHIRVIYIHHVHVTCLEETKVLGYGDRVSCLCRFEAPPLLFRRGCALLRRFLEDRFLGPHTKAYIITIMRSKYHTK